MLLPDKTFTPFNKLLYAFGAVSYTHLGEQHLRWICDHLLQQPDKGGSVIKTCPHGRPVAFEITKNSLERQFERIT